MTVAVSTERHADAEASVVQPIKVESLKFSLLVALLFCIACAFGMAHHELWTDEMQAWLIARDSPDLATLALNCRAEFHPLFWFLCLSALTKLTHAPVAMQVAQLTIATTSAFLLARFAPFPRWAKVLLVLGYFPLFEYGVISRCYSLGVLLLLASLICFSRRVHYAWQIPLLILLANTSAFGAVMACAMACSLLFEALRTGVIRLPRERKQRITVFACVAAISAAAAVVVARMIPPDIMSFVTKFSQLEPGALRPPQVSEAWRALVQSYIPIPDLRYFHFWNTDLFLRILGGGMTSCTAVAISSLAFWSLILRRRPMALLLYLSGSAALMASYSIVRYYPVLRHQGHLFLILIAALWLSHTASQSRSHDPTIRLSTWLSRLEKPALALILIAHVTAAAIALWMDYKYPFSTGKLAAQYLQEQNLSSLPIVAYHPEGCTLAGYLDCRLYYPRIADYGSFVNWEYHCNGRPVPGGLKGVPSSVRAFVLKQKTPCVLAVNVFGRSNHAKSLAIDGLRIQPLRNFEQSICERETTYLFLASPADSALPAVPPSD